ncbi:MAG: efflux RND transporter permease subunit [Myxococcales bacterium]|nr:efflux RND transporter permease subunit [Myxococcales bacterium]
MPTSVVDPMPETTVRPDFARAAALGVDGADIIGSLRLFIAGNTASTFEDRGEQYDVVVRGPERFRSHIEALAMLSVPSRTLGSVPLSDVVVIDAGTGPAQINRLSRMRQVAITSNLAPGGKENEVMAALGKIVAAQKLPPGYKAEPFGRSRESAKVGAAFAFAFFLAFVFMYLVLAAQFESWVHPLTILICLPLTVPFALMAVILFGIQLDMFSMLGLLVLFGVVKKNSILQIDQSNQLRATGMPRFEAIMEANRSRLRPILMTTVAFVAGMLPLVFSHGIGSGFSKSMASIVVGGQTLSLLLTLLATPVFYSLFDDAGLAVKRVLGQLFPRQVIDRGEQEVLAASSSRTNEG